MSSSHETCPRCNYTVDKYASYCSQCGGSLLDQLAASSDLAAKPTTQSPDAIQPPQLTPPLNASAVKLCIRCRSTIAGATVFCPFCGSGQTAAYGGSAFSAGPVASPLQQASIYGSAPSAVQFELDELARRYQQANSTYTWTLVVGLLLFWPLLIVTFQENRKKKDILARVAALGVEPTIWKNTAV